MDFELLLVIWVIVSAAVLVLERGLKKAAERRRKKDEYRVYRNAGGLLFTIVTVVMVFFFLGKALYPEYLNGKYSLFFYAVGVYAVIVTVREIIRFFTMQITVTAMEITYRDRHGRMQTTGIPGLRVTETKGSRSSAGKIEVFDSEGKRLFWFHSNLVNAEYFVKDMKEREVRRSAEGIWNG